MIIKEPFNNKKANKSYLLKNGQLINLNDRKLEVKDLLIENKKIKKNWKQNKYNSKGSRDN